jgi:hypothetical protein
MFSSYVLLCLPNIAFQEIPPPTCILFLFPQFELLNVKMRSQLLKVNGKGLKRRQVLVLSRYSDVSGEGLNKLLVRTACL